MEVDRIETPYVKPNRTFEKVMFCLIGAVGIVQPSGLITGKWLTVLMLVGSFLSLVSSVFGEKLARNNENPRDRKTDSGLLIVKPGVVVRPLPDIDPVQEDESTPTTPNRPAEKP